MDCGKASPIPGHVDLTTASHSQIQTWVQKWLSTPFGLIPPSLVATIIVGWRDRRYFETSLQSLVALSGTSRVKFLLLYQRGLFSVSKRSDDEFKLPASMEIIEQWEPWKSRIGEYHIINPQEFYNRMRLTEEVVLRDAGTNARPPEYPPDFDGMTVTQASLRKLMVEFRQKWDQLLPPEYPPPEIGTQSKCPPSEESRMKRLSKDHAYGWIKHFFVILSKVFGCIILIVSRRQIVMKL